jgi:YVTN family beta-propeller protein
MLRVVRPPHGSAISSREALVVLAARPLSRCGPAAAALVAGLALVAPPRALAVSFHSTAIDITPDGSEVWVVNPDHGTVGVISALGASSALLAEVPVGAEPWCVDIHPSNGEVWVTSMGENKVYVLDGPSRSVITTIDNLGFETFGVAFNPAGTAALVTASGSDQLFEINTATRAVSRTVSVYRRPRGIAWRADGVRAWVTHLLMPEFLGRLTVYFISTGTTSTIAINQVFHPNNGGYPSTVQNATLAPPPNDAMLWLPNNMINTTAGQLSGTPLTPANIMHAVISPVNITTGVHSSSQTYYLSQSGTDVGGPIAVDFRDSRAFVANLHSNDVTVLNQDILSPGEVSTVSVGKGPIGIVAHPTFTQVYVANWLSRNVTVFTSGAGTVLATVPSTYGPEPLSGSILNGKQLFFTSNDPMALNEVGSCASCHVWGTMDARRWDLSQFGKHLRGTPDVRGIGFTGAHDWTGDKDEMQDHEFGILEFTGGAGLTGGPNPPLGPPNKGLSQGLDDIGQYMATLVPRTRTPFQNPDGSLTASGLAGETVFNDPTVGCADCHIPPFYTDSRLDLPFIKHDVGTADSADADAAAGLDTPTLCGIWDTGPYLHMNFDNLTLASVFSVYNPSDEHGTTSQLTGQQMSDLLSFLLQIAWPESTGTPVGAPAVAPAASPLRGSLESAYPNPFDEATSFRFSLEVPARDVRIDVFDVSGRRVRALFDRRLPRGTHIAGWDGADDAGRRVRAGVYFARLTVDGRAQGEKKLTILR